MKKYFLKKFIPVYQSESKVCIGYINKNKYIEIERTDSNNYDVLKRIIQVGVTKKDILRTIYKELFDFEFLELKPNYVSIKNIDREELYFQYLNNNGLDNSIKKKRILIFGAGAGGSTITYLLAQIGFSNLVIIDEDVVNKTDVSKSIVFDTEQIGVSKVEATSNRIKKNFGINLVYEETNFIGLTELELLIDKYQPDFIIKACDPELVFRLNLNKVCFEKGIPFIMMAYAFELLRLGPLYVPGFTSCDESFNQMVKKAYGEYYDFRSDKKLFTNNLVHPAISFNVNMLASYILKEILMFLTGQYEYCFTIGRLVELNPLSLSISSFEANCQECDVCLSELINANE